MNKYCIIAIYFGKLPKYFSLWLNSCGNNVKIDFLFFTDQNVEIKYPNIKRYVCSLKDIKKLIEKKLHIDNVCLEQPYKLCDFRPAFGIIFDEYIESYAYWGHCDFDMIFGNIIAFFEKYSIDNYDKFLTQGHLSMYRNTKEINERYKELGGKYNYLEAFKSDKSKIFDELCGIVGIYKSNGYSMFTKKIFADITPIHKRFTLSEVTKLGEKCINYKKQIFYWENGHIYRDYITDTSFDNKIHQEEFIYIHFRARPNFDVPKEIRETKAYYITQNGFVSKKCFSSKDVFDKYSKYCYLLEKFEDFLAFINYAEIKYHFKKIMKIFHRGKLLN